ncbi:MAG: hypothetical protein IKH81_02305 [Clostridia bacterium]|nr:hypothetical protein [Clostridia bacterium]
MKKLFCLFLVLALMLSGSALALDYNWKLDNEAAFLTMSELKAESGERSHAALADYPEEGTYVYYSANLYGVTAANRMNTNITVFCGEQFETKDDAFAYIKDLGLVDIIDKAIGSIVLITPSTPLTEGSSGSMTGGTFAAVDANAYYKLQTVQCQLSSAEGSKIGYFGYHYVIAIGDGATFFNDYIAPRMDFITRIAGVLLIGGDMTTDLKSVGGPVPAYIVNAGANVAEAYAKAIGANAWAHDGAKEYAYNQQLPVRKVVSVAMDNVDNKALIEDVYNNFLVKAMTIAVLKDGVNSTGTPFSGYGNDDAPYSLTRRNAILGTYEDGYTADGIIIKYHKEDRFDKEGLVSKNEDGSVYEYLQTWWELLPQEVLDNTAPAHSVPLWLANHGGGDDPVQFVDEIGLLTLAGTERFGIVAPYYQSMYSGFGGAGDAVPMCNALDALVEYMLETYPALDPSRVYVTGYSLGGGATLHAVFGNPALFAAAIPMSAAWYAGNEEQQAAFEKVDLPIMMTTSTYDLGGAFSNPPISQISTTYQNEGMNTFLGYNGMDPITFDFDANPISGFRGDLFRKEVLNGEYDNYQWFMAREDGAPMVGVAYTANLKHALYPEFGPLAWNWAKHFSRNQETGEIVYNPLVK